MKAMILAAGRGTRLLPFTRHTLKPLFTLNRRPVLDLTLERLKQAGCREVTVNTHHLHDQIEALVNARDDAMAVHTCHEPEILGTGGAIRNVASFWAGGPLLVINADIVTDIDLAAICRFHNRNACPVTMVMHDHPDFNTVAVDQEDCVAGFDASGPDAGPLRRLAFTGIHVLDGRVLDFLPRSGPAHIIDAYAKMIAAGERIKAFIATGHYWRDIGTPAAYKAAAFEHMAPEAFACAFGSLPREPIRRRPLQGDGSDRQWHRLTAGPRNLIMADHGIRPHRDTRQEVDAFVDIGRHLYARGAAVPRIYLHDTFAGLVFLEDLGDRHLQDAARELKEEQLRQLYCRVIDQWLDMAVQGGRGFDVAWTYQGARYDRRLILDRECRYFVEAFLNGYLGRPDAYAEMADEFEQLADHALVNGWTGFMHRDLQSRNIMIKAERICFIDFQGGRLGPLQYDLASLLIDPYTALDPGLQDDLRTYAARALHRRTGAHIERFLQGFDYCAVARNLQILGAFGYLSRVKGKTYFEAYIPAALSSLQRRLSILRQGRLHKLRALLAHITSHPSSNHP